MKSTTSNQSEMNFLEIGNDIKLLFSKFSDIQKTREEVNHSNMSLNLSFLINQLNQPEHFGVSSQSLRTDRFSSSNNIQEHQEPVTFNFTITQISKYTSSPITSMDSNQTQADWEVSINFNILKEKEVLFIQNFMIQRMNSKDQLLEVSQIIQEQIKSHRNLKIKVQIQQHSTSFQSYKDVSYLSNNSQLSLVQKNFAIIPGSVNFCFNPFGHLTIVSDKRYNSFDKREKLILNNETDIQQMNQRIQNNSKNIESLDAVFGEDKSEIMHEVASQQIWEINQDPLMMIDQSSINQLGSLGEPQMQSSSSNQNTFGAIKYDFMNFFTYRKKKYAQSYLKNVKSLITNQDSTIVADEANHFDESKFIEVKGTKRLSELNQMLFDKLEWDMFQEQKKEQDQSDSLLVFEVYEVSHLNPFNQEVRDIEEAIDLSKLNQRSSLIYLNKLYSQKGGIYKKFQQDYLINKVSMLNQFLYKDKEEEEELQIQPPEIKVSADQATTLVVQEISNLQDFEKEQQKILKIPSPSEAHGHATYSNHNPQSVALSFPKLPNPIHPSSLHQSQHYKYSQTLFYKKYNLHILEGKYPFTKSSILNCFVNTDAQALFVEIMLQSFFNSSIAFGFQLLVDPAIEITETDFMMFQKLFRIRIQPICKQSPIVLFNSFLLELALNHYYLIFRLKESLDSYLLKDKIYNMFQLLDTKKIEIFGLNDIEVILNFLKDKVGQFYEEDISSGGIGQRQHQTPNLITNIEKATLISQSMQSNTNLFRGKQVRQKIERASYLKSILFSPQVTFLQLITEQEREQITSNLLQLQDQMFRQQKYISRMMVDKLVTYSINLRQFIADIDLVSSERPKFTNCLSSKAYKVEASLESARFGPLTNQSQQQNQPQINIMNSFGTINNANMNTLSQYSHNPPVNQAQLHRKMSKISTELKPTQASRNDNQVQQKPSIQTNNLIEEENHQGSLRESKSTNQEIQQRAMAVQKEQDNKMDIEDMSATERLDMDWNYINHRITKEIRADSLVNLLNENEDSKSKSDEAEGQDQEFENEIEEIVDLKNKCGVCGVKVKGLKGLCMKCGHGGHLNHLTEWFATNKNCPICFECQCQF